MSDAPKVILPDSPEAATYQTVSGWVSAKGHFYGKDERLARYDGSTHRPCSECGELIEKNSYCRPCHAKKEIAKYDAMPRKEWDGTTPLYSETADQYFFSEDELRDYSEVEGPTIEEMRLTICVPTYAGEIEPSELYERELPEEGDIPEELQKAFDDLNEFIRESKIILSWTPGKFAAEVGDE